MYRLAIVCTHPIQYYSPLFKILTESAELNIRVFYGWEGPSQSIDHGFGHAVAWDIPMLEGHEHEFVPNTAHDPGSHHYRGIICPTLTQRIEQWHANAVLIIGWRYHAHRMAMKYFFGRAPILFRGDSTLLGERPGVKRWLRRRVLKRVYRHVNAALYVGSHNRDYFLAHGLSEKQLFFAPHSVENERFQQDEHDAMATKERRRLNIADHEVVFSFAGKLEPVKRPELLVREFLRIRRSSDHLMFAGSGPLEHEIRRLVDDGNAHHIHFLGFQNQSQMPTFYRMADVLCLPSSSETWGLAINEAMACGRAIIASDAVGSAVDLVQPGKNGWIFRSDNSDSFGAVLREASMLGRDGLAEMGHHYARIIANWTLQHLAEAICNAVRHLVK